jgi:hypothetical protein
LSHYRDIVLSHAHCAFVKMEVGRVCWRKLSPDLSSLALPLSPSLFASLCSPASDHVRSLRVNLPNPPWLFSELSTHQKSDCSRVFFWHCYEYEMCSPLLFSLLSSWSPSFAPSSNPPIALSPTHSHVQPRPRITQTPPPSRRRHLRRGTPGNTQSIS